MTEDEEPLARLEKAVQDFINEIDPEAPILLRGCAIVWESQRLNEDGDVAHKISYATTQSTGLAACVGLMDVGKAQMIDDILS